MSPQSALILTYICFIWLVVLHTFEEIASGIMDTKIGHIQLTRNKYLLGASVISTLNLTALALLILDLPAGYYLGLFTSAVIGVVQGLVHTVGFLKEKRTAHGLGAGFYSSIPLALFGIYLFIQILQQISVN